MTHLFHGPG